MKKATDSDLWNIVTETVDITVHNIKVLLPTPVSTVKRSFSCLILLKTYLRNSRPMTETLALTTG